MKKIYLILLAIGGVSLSSCTIQEVQIGGSTTGGAREVEISIATSGDYGTRAALDGDTTDLGRVDYEDRIAELDLLVFDKDGKYMYRREAYKLTGSTGRTYRAMLSEYWEPMTIHFLANSRSILTAWETGANKPTVGSSTWDQVKLTLIDTLPTRLVNSTTYQPLPMWGTGKVTLQRDVAPNVMPGTIEMLRSVASFDLFVLDGTVPANTSTKDFVLTDLYAVHAADRGYLAADSIKPVVTPQQQYTIPAGMKTFTWQNGKVLHANGTSHYLNPEGKSFNGIAYQMYAYDNYNSAVVDSTSRPTRLVVAGYYKQTDPDTTKWKKSYYPVDVSYSDGKFRPVIRNWKYEFMVTAVTGPGKPTLDEARNAVNENLNISVIQWNKSDVEIGVTGKYYVSMDRRAATLWRDASASQTLKLGYVYIDNGTDNDFSVDFKKDSLGTSYLNDNGTVNSGTPSTAAGVTTTTIDNDWFEVTMKQTPATEGGGGTVTFEVVAKQNYDADHAHDALVVTYRNLEFEISIDQINMSYADWIDGGHIPTDL